MITKSKQLINKEFCNLKTPAVITPHKTVSYHQLFSAVDSCNNRLKSEGIQPGDRVALVGPNSLEHLIALISLWSIKAIACPLNMHLPQEVLSDQIQKIKAQQINMNDLVNCSSIERSTINITYEPDQAATIIFTSGSGGQPKPALHSIDNHIASAQASNQMIPLESGDQWLLSLPLYHVGGLGILFRSLCAGATIVVAESQENAFELIADGKITHMSCVSTHLARLLSKKDSLANLRKMKAILVGGSAIPKSLLDEGLNCDLT